MQHHDHHPMDLADAVGTLDDDVPGQPGAAADNGVRSLAEFARGRVLVAISIRRQLGMAIDDLPDSMPEAATLRRRHRRRMA